MFRVLFLIFLIVGAAGCETYGGTGSSRDSLIAIQYGTIESINRAEVDANVAQGAAVGGLVGLAAAAGTGGSTGQQVGATALGALIGGLIQNQRAANNQAERYTVRLTNGSTVAVVTEHHNLVVGDCVSVEQGRHTNIRRVSPVMCDSMARAGHPAYETTHSANMQEADECEQVKQELLAAKTSEEADVAYQKMRAFCEH